MNSTVCDYLSGISYRRLSRLKTVCAVFVLILLCFVLACSTPKETQSVTLGIIYDCSKSAPQNQVPSLTADHLDSLIAMCQSPGGTLAFLPILKSSYHQLKRVEMIPLDDKSLKDKAVLMEWQKTHINEFKQQVLDVVNDGRKSPRTDFWGAIHRYKQLFRELAPGGQRRQFLFIVSDGIDDVKRWPAIELSEDITVFAVGLSLRTDAYYMTGNIIVYESIEPALEYLSYLIRYGKEIGEI